MQYNLCNEPRIKYSMAAVADRGLKPSQWTSARLRAEVLVLETHRMRYELSRNAPPPDAPEELLVRPAGPAHGLQLILLYTLLKTLPWMYPISQRAMHCRATRPRTCS